VGTFGPRKPNGPPPEEPLLEPLPVPLNEPPSSASGTRASSERNDEGR